MIQQCSSFFLSHFFVLLQSVLDCLNGLIKDQKFFSTLRVMKDTTMSLFKIDITTAMGAEYIPMFNDIARFVMIQVGIQIMLSLTDGAKFPFFSSEFFLLVSFIVVGVMLYHLVFKNVVEFK